MVLRPEAIKERLLRLEEVISHLEQLGTPGEQDLRADFRTAWLAERGLQLAAEIAFDVGNHILSAHFGASARDYEDILEQLGERGVIDADLRDRFRGLGGFRNILVHGYLAVDPIRVHAAVTQRLGDLERFAACMAQLM